VPRGVTVDFTSRSVYDPFVCEVGRQRVVICGKRARAAHNPQSQHVEIVGGASRAGAKALFLALKFFRIGGPQAPCSIQLHELPSHVLIHREFFLELSRGDEAGTAAFPKSQSMIAPDCTRNLGATFASTIRHTSDTQKIALFFEEELPEAGRRIGDAAVRVKFQVVDRGAGLAAFEVKQRDVFGP
jgi:hypothetical protein